MLFTIDWLKEHLETNSPPKEIIDRLSMLGLEVEKVENKAELLEPFLIGHVKKVHQHPNADRLRICLVDTGTTEVQVVCGAPNARAGMKGVFAASGAYIPGTDTELKKTKIRGEISDGMLCSEREMGLSDDHVGIIELSEDAPVGERWATWAGVGEVIVDIALTPNRGDCASVRGIARDLAAAGLGNLKPLKASPVKGSFSSPTKWKIDFPKKFGSACPFVTGRTFRNLKNGDSPKWLQDRLTAIGLRPISALVDITNWATFDLGRPLHVFDADKLSGDLCMRLARKGETILALDEVNYELEDGMIVIADDMGPQAIGGIIGGDTTKCSHATKNVFLEVALFDPVFVAQTGRKLGILSDARYRFERGVDPTSTDWGTEIVSRMILDICGGEASELTSAGKLPNYECGVSLREGRVQSLGGVKIKIEEQKEILSRLGFAPKIKNKNIQCEIPPWRSDVEVEADLVEEVVRIHGYDNINPVPMPRDFVIPKPVRNMKQSRTEKIRRILAARGMVETVTYSFMDGEIAKHFGEISDSLRLVNPISTDLSVMRPSILPNLISAIAKNQARGIRDMAIFEIGPQYVDDSPSGQKLVAAGARTGLSQPRTWTNKSEPVDIFHAKADLMSALSSANIPVEKLQQKIDSPIWYHPGKSACLWLGKNLLGSFGELHPSITEAIDAEGPISVFELFFDNLPKMGKKQKSSKPLLELSSFQPVNRDYAFIVDEGVLSEDVIQAVRSAERSLIVDVSLFDVYRGEGIEKGKKSLAFAVILQPIEATMTDEEIDKISLKIVESVNKKTDGTLRQ